MKKKALLFLAIMAMLVCALAISIGAKSVYLEPIPDELKAENDTMTHFVVFEEEKYFERHSYGGEPLKSFCRREPGS